MHITLVGLFVFLFGSVLLFTSTIEAMFAFAVLCTLMGGAAAFVVSALGNSSIPPAQLALAFFILRVVMPSAEHKPFAPAFRANIFFVIFAVYAAISAMIMPRIFAHKINVVPMRPAGLKFLYDTFPLVFTSQNITASVYVIGSLMFAVMTFIAVRQPNGAVRAAKTATVLVWIHVALGIAGITLPRSIWSVVTAIFRNGSYAQLEQSVGTYLRIAGIMPEPSAYAGYGFCWFVFTAEMWLRDILPRRTGPAAAAMMLVLILSMSSTGYVGLGAYAVVLVLRMGLFPTFFRARKIFWLVGGIAVVATLIAAIAVMKPALATSLADILAHFTVDKAESSSGQQRKFWAMQGLHAFVTSYGLGIGAGSFRSSSFVTAVIGSTGVIGAFTYLCYLGMIFRPLRSATFMQPRDRIDGVGVSASWAALFTFIATAVASPSPDPGNNFAIFAGIALGLRTLRRNSPERQPVDVRALTLPPRPYAIAGKMMS